jgi:hypothetical protein
MEVWNSSSYGGDQENGLSLTRRAFFSRHADEQNFLPPIIIARLSVTKVPQLSHLTITVDFSVALPGSGTVLGRP